MGHDIFNASATATWIECPWSALNGVPNPPRKASTVEASEAGTEKHERMEAGEVPDVEAFLSQLEDPGYIRREYRVRLTENCGGTIDVFAPHYRVTTILDGKFGKWDVSAFHNLQLLTYSASTLKETDAEWFRFVIYQPHGLDEDPWKQSIHHRSEVIAHRDRILRVIGTNNPQPKPGPHCRWCKGFQVCPAMHDDGNFVMAAISRPPESLTTQELVRLLRLVRALGDMKAVYEEHLTMHLRLGRTAEGASLKTSRTFRAYNDERQAAQFVAEKYGVQHLKPPSPAQLEKLGPEGKAYAQPGMGVHKPTGEPKASY